MRLFLILLAISTLAAAGPLPSFSNTTLEAGAPPSIPADITIPSDPVADLTKLKAIYDNLNQTEPNANSMVKRGFWKWLKDAFEAPGLKARSPDSVSVPDKSTLGSDPMEALSKLKAVYDRLQETDRNATLKVKRNFWKWLKDAFEAPGLKARSPDSATMSDDEALDFDPVAVLTKLKAVYDSQNEKRMEGGVKEKRNFWQWLKDAFEAPGLKARSPDSATMPDNEALDSNPVAVLTKLKVIYDNQNEKRMEGSVKEKRNFWKWLKDAFEAPGL